MKWQLVTNCVRFCFFSNSRFPTPDLGSYKKLWASFGGCACAGGSWSFARSGRIPGRPNLSWMGSPKAISHHQLVPMAWHQPVPLKKRHLLSSTIPSALSRNRRSSHSAFGHVSTPEITGIPELGLNPIAPRADENPTPSILWEFWPIPNCQLNCLKCGRWMLFIYLILFNVVVVESCTLACSWPF